MDSKTKHALLLNPLSMIGMPLAVFGFFAGIVLISLDVQHATNNPYFGVLAYFVIPVIINLGLILIAIGAWRQRKRLRKRHEKPSSFPVINLNERKQFTLFAIISSLTLIFAVLAMVGGYQTFHYTESTAFCGTVCHEVMKPEYTAFQHSPHANVLCTECHIGPGAESYVKAKLNGLRQVKSAMTDSYARPIETPLPHIRPANETCYTCHWPEKEIGDVEFSRTYFSCDDDNTSWTTRMLVHVGGGGGKHSEAHGIHWHAVSSNKVEYIATDSKRLEIPWVRVTDPEGNETIYQTNDEDLALSEEAIQQAQPRRMDCTDCHNRPAHQFQAPAMAMDRAMTSGRVDPAIESIKANGVSALIGEYETEAEALLGIREKLVEEYPDGGAKVDQSIRAIQQIYQQNFFPEMNVNWKAYPDHIGHMISPGCIRCHDGNHVSNTGKVIRQDCNLCHTIIAQGPGPSLESFTSGGLEYKHPEDIDEEWKSSKCTDCHEGTSGI